MIEALPPTETSPPCTGCGGTKGVPLACVVTLGPAYELHPALVVAADAVALGRMEEADKLVREFNESAEPAHLVRSVRIALCEECGRDAANAIGFMCVRDGGWSKLEPKKRKVCR